MKEEDLLTKEIMGQLHMEKELILIKMMYIINIKEIQKKLILKKK